MCSKKFISAVLIMLAGQGCLVLAAQDRQQLYDSVITVIADRSKPFDIRYEAATKHWGYFSAEQRDRLEIEMKAMLPEAKKLDDKTKAIHLYGNIAVVTWTRRRSDLDIAKLYVDSAMMYENRASDLGKAKLYIVAGTYYAAAGETVTAHEYYYKSIACYEKVGGYYDEQVAMLFNIATYYTRLNDTASVRAVIEKMKPLAKRDRTFKSYWCIYSQIANYYDMLYEADPQPRYLDSTRVNYLRVIGRYESLKPPPTILKGDMAYIYLYYTDYFLHADRPDADSICRYTRKAMETNTADLQLKLMCYTRNTEGYVKLRQYDRALEWAMEALGLAEQPYISSAPLSELYKTVSEIHACRKDFEQALKYATLYCEKKLSVADSERASMAKELETRYEVAKKEESIQRLTERNRYRENISRLYLGMLALAVAVCLFVILWYRGRRRADADRLQMAKMQSYLNGLESERSRLAKELHDHVANGLLALEMKMESSGVSGELTGMASTLHGQVREISHALIPPVFQYASLPEIIDNYVREQNRLDGPCFQFYLTPEEGWELPQQTALDLYRILQESCSNAIKHACAKNIVISLSRNGNRIELSITDDGQGFNLAEAKKGIGLQTVSERAAGQNATVSIDSAPGKGTAITVTVRI